MILKNFSNRRGIKSPIKSSDRNSRQRNPDSGGPGSAAGYGGVFITTVMWATSGVFIKLTLSSAEISEYSLAFYRDLATFFCLLFILLIFRRDLLRIDRRDIPWLAALGGLGLGVFHLLWNFGVGINGVAVSTVQQAIMPIILAVAARLAFKEPFNSRKIIAVVLTLVGSVFLSGLLRGGPGPVNITGIAVGFLIPVAYAMFNLFGKKITGKYHSFTILTYGFGFGALVLLPIQFFVPPPENFPAVSCLWLGGLVIISTLLPFALYTATLRKLQVSIAGILSMAEIPVAFLYASLLFSESFTLYQWIGTAFVVGGVSLFIMLNRNRHPKKPADQFTPPV